MAETIQYAKKIGGSLMVRIPKGIVEIEHIQPGEAVKMDIQKVRKDWFGALRTGRPYKKEEERFRFHHE
jgi:antitoxin component of MazEF toxin-antitoxin module